jgi:rubrerythrin
MSLLGITKGTDVEKQIDQIAALESQGVTMYNGMAILAREQGYDDVADHLIALAIDEARHAGLYAVLNGHIKANFFEILKTAASVEVGSVKKLQEFAQKIRNLGLMHAAQAVEETALDEGRHGSILKEIVDTYASKF